MRHIQSFQLIRDVLIEARRELLDAMMKDPNSSIHWIDYTPEIFNRLDQAVRECNSYNLKGK